MPLDSKTKEFDHGFSLIIESNNEPILKFSSFAVIHYPNHLSEGIFVHQLQSILPSILEIVKEKEIKQIQIHTPLTWTTLNRYDFIQANMFLSAPIEAVSFPKSESISIQVLTNADRLEKLVYHQYLHHYQLNSCYYTKKTKIRAQKSLKYYNRMLQSQYGFLLIANVCNQTIGYLFGEKENDNLYIEDLYIEGPFRGKGIGTSLLQNLLRIAKEQKVTTFSLEVATANEEAMGFYEKYGFMKQSLRWIRNLD